MYDKRTFVQEALMMETTVNANKKHRAGPLSEQRWSTQYDLYASGHRGPEVHETTLILCESATSLCTPCEGLDAILARYETLGGL